MIEPEQLPTLGSQRSTRNPIVYRKFYTTKGGIYLAYEGGHLQKPNPDPKKKPEQGPYIMFGLVYRDGESTYEYFTEADLQIAGASPEEDFRPTPLQLVKKQEGIC